MQTLREFVVNNDYFVVAHRGSSGTAPENTMAAYREAIEAGALMIETDIQITSDCNLVTFHDKSLKRVYEKDTLIKELNINEIKEIDYGSWFNPKFSGERIPLLSEAISYLRDKAYLNIEIKRIEPELFDLTLNKLLQIIYDANYEGNLLVSSFHYNLLKHFRKLEPTIPIAPIKIPNDNTLPSRLFDELGCEAYVCSLSELNDSLVSDAESRNIFLGVYSVDNAEQLQQILKYNIKAIVTNYPARIIGEMRKLNINI